MSRKLPPTLVVAAAAVALLVAGPAQGAGTAHAASPSTITACVQTKTGTIKVLTTAKAKKKKCAKGYQRVTWTLAGTAGMNGTNGKDGANGTNGKDGTNGTPLAVLSATGNVVGLSLGLESIGPISIYYVLAGGGIWTYAGNGELFPSTVASPVLFTDSTCSGQPSLAIDPANASFVASQYRVVLRPYNTLSGALGTPRAWKLGAAAGTESAGQTYYSQDSTGACAPSTSAHTGDPLFSLTPVAVPADVPGPLTTA